MKSFFAIAISLCILVPFISGENLNFRVEMDNGRMFPYQIDDQVPVLTLKLDIAEFEDIDPDTMRIFFREQEMQEFAPLNAYPIQRGEKLQVRIGPARFPNSD